MTRRQSRAKIRHVTPGDAKQTPEAFTDQFLQSLIDGERTPDFALTVAVNVLREVLVQTLAQGEPGVMAVRTVTGKLSKAFDKIVLAPGPVRLKEILENPKAFS